MGFRQNKRTKALNDYADLVPQASRKWLVRCVACGRIGYREGTPRLGVWGFRRGFAQLDLDDSGLCAECSAALEHDD